MPAQDEFRDQHAPDQAEKLKKDYQRHFSLEKPNGVEREDGTTQRNRHYTDKSGVPKHVGLSHNKRQQMLADQRSFLMLVGAEAGVLFEIIGRGVARSASQVMRIGQREKPGVVDRGGGPCRLCVATAALRGDACEGQIGRCSVEAGTGVSDRGASITKAKVLL